MEQYLVTGMSCAACQARVEKAVRSVKGVDNCSVSLLTNSMGVEGTASPDEIIKAVENAGYGASLKFEDKKNESSFSKKISSEEEALKDKTTPKLKKRLFTSLAFLIVLMYFSMGHSMFGFPLPVFFNDNCIAIGLVEMILTIVIMVINRQFFISGFKSLIHRSPNMDTLIALGSSAAFVYSTVILFIMTRAQADGDTTRVMNLMMEFYFESSAMILTLITVGKTLESYSKGKTTNALKSLMKLAPKTANVIRDGKETTIPIDDVKVGDVFVVRPGENIPVDGTVIEGESAIDESALTGESIPVDKVAGNMVSSATLNQSGFLKCSATKVGEDTTFAQIIKMVSEAAATKAPVARLADRISGVFVPVVILLSIITFTIWMIIGQTIGYSLARGITILVVSCPCALGLATPVAIMVGNGMGAKNGILFKNAEALQETGNVQIVALDKTGTITSGQPKVTDLFAEKDKTIFDLLKTAYAMETKSEHPLAKAVTKYAEEQKVELYEASEFSSLSGSGITATVNGEKCYAGNRKFIEKFAVVPQSSIEKAEELSSEGKTPLFFAADGSLIGIIAVADTIKEDSPKAIQELKNMGIHVVMITGDNEKTAKAIGEQAGVDEIVASVMPNEKEKIISELQKHGKVCMVGDGINDAPALTRADIGMAIGAGTDVAIDSADVVLMKNKLTDVSSAIRLSRKTYVNIVENLFWALIYNTCLIPIAAGAFVWAGLTMDPMYGAAAMSLSSFCVCMNALRLNLFNIHNPKRDKKRNNSIKVGESGKILLAETKGESNMNVKTMEIKGMMCPHCEATVKKALEAVEGVASAQVSHVEGKAVVTLNSSVEDSTLKQAVEAKDFTVVSIS
ncbi:MAG: cadmium-translocating P-type ATPase [Clostridiales bacterium]|nr:cadmium-translocating P-type ATPase [Clostridiales bacterium]